MGIHVTKTFSRNSKAPMMVRQEERDWTEFRKLPDSIEVDFHYSECGPREVSYDEAMQVVWDNALDAIRRAHSLGLKYVIFTHGQSTSRPGKTTGRSQVRRLLRSREATAFVLRSLCIQHSSCFVAAIRENPQAQMPILACPDCGSRNTRPKTTVGYFRCGECPKEFGWFDLQ